MSLDFGFDHAGPYTIMHHQHYQMVDLLILCCRKTMGGLNPHALPYVPSKQQKVPKESTHDQKKNINTVKPPTWHACKKKKGNRCKNINKKKIDKETKIFGNRFSRLREMVEDSQEVMDVLEKAVDKVVHQNENKGKEDEENKYDVDSVETQTLDEEIKKHVDQDKNESFNENVDNNSDETDDEVEVNQSASNEECEYDSYDSEKVRYEHRLMHPDSDSECVVNSECEYSDSDESIVSVASNFELWHNNRVRYIHETCSE